MISYGTGCNKIDFFFFFLERPCFWKPCIVKRKKRAWNKNPVTVQDISKPLILQLLSLLYHHHPWLHLKSITEIWFLNMISQFILVFSFVLCHKIKTSQIRSSLYVVSVSVSVSLSVVSISVSVSVSLFFASFCIPEWNDGGFQSQHRHSLPAMYISHRWKKWSSKPPLKSWGCSLSKTD